MLKGYPVLYIHRLFDLVRHEGIRKKRPQRPRGGTDV